MKRNFKKKSIITIVIIAILIILLVTLIVFLGRKNKTNENVNEDVQETKISLIDNLDIEVYSEITNLDLIKEIKNGEIISEKEQIDTSSLGNKEIIITYLNEKNKEKEYKFNINIIDSEKPIIDYNSPLTTTVGTKIDLLKGVSAKDNYTEDIEVTISGEYDFNKVGEYTIYYKATDSSNNETKEEAKLIVKEKSSEPKVEQPQTNNNTTPNSNEFTTSKGFKGYTKNGITYIDGILIANKTYSLPQNYGPGLTAETQAAINSMSAAAATDGINIYCQSGFRSFETQQRLYSNYSKRDGAAAADIYSARPGHSEHQSGLACDLCSKNNSACINSGFDSSNEAKWLSNNAYKFGMILRYPEGKTNETGYKYESWHYRYVGVDLATKLYNNGNWITLEDYFGITSEYK